MAVIQPTRRGLITGGLALFAAPTIVWYSSLMPVKALTLELRPLLYYRFSTRHFYALNTDGALFQFTEAGLPERWDGPETL